MYLKIFSIQYDTMFYTVSVVNDTPLWSPLHRGDEKSPPYQRGIEGVVNNEWWRSFAWLNTFTESVDMYSNIVSIYPKRNIRDERNK